MDQLYDVVHVTGTGERIADCVKDRAVAVAKQLARKSGNRHAVVQAGTDNVVAVVWADGGVDFQTQPYPTIGRHK